MTNKIKKGAAVNCMVLPFLLPVSSDWSNSSFYSAYVLIRSVHSGHVLSRLFQHPVDPFLLMLQHTF